jgi:hypothetical protein
MTEDSIRRVYAFGRYLTTSGELERERGVLGAKYFKYPFTKLLNFWTSIVFCS